MAYYQIGLDETVSWIGNAICLSGQLMQILETNDTKSAKDLSIGFLNMNFLGNFMFFIYGIGSGSTSMIVGMGFASAFSIYQIVQKYWYDREGMLGTPDVFASLRSRNRADLEEGEASEKEAIIQGSKHSNTSIIQQQQQQQEQEQEQENALPTVSAVLTHKHSANISINTNISSSSSKHTTSSSSSPYHKKNSPSSSSSSRKRESKGGSSSGGLSLSPSPSLSPKSNSKNKNKIMLTVVNHDENNNSLQTAEL